jgi:ribonuclease J
MTSLTFYGGAGEIGGNKILLESEEAKVYLDFGQSFNFGSDYFYEWLEPRAANGLECYFEFGLVPRIRKLYSRTMLRFTDLPYEVSDIDGVFITHHHGDHINDLVFLDEEVPIFMGQGCKAILDAYSKLYPSLCDIGEHNSIRLFKTGDKIALKDLSFRPIHVEHSTPGAYGYIIETKGGNIVYTGDLRRHGPKKQMTDEFIDEASKAKPHVLLCEGTRMTQEPENYYSEEQVHEKVENIVKKSEGLVLAEFSMCNIDRFNSFYKAAKESGRTLIIDTRYAYILDSLRDKVELPNPKKDQYLKVYFRLSKSCEYCERDYFKYEQEYMCNMITFREVKNKPKGYVMFTGFNKLMELVYIQPEKADYIFSSSEHFLEGEENRDQRRVLENWLNHFGITLHKAHCSGHAGKGDLEYIIKKINPDILVPIHTQNPEEFKKIHDNVKIVKRGDRLEI